MKLLSLLHRWIGGIIGLVLVVLGLTGAILVWEDKWIGLPGSDQPVVQSPEVMARIVDDAGPELSRVTFAHEGMSLHQLVYADGSGAYVDQTGTVVARWASKWERPELWLFDLHHYLFAGETGEWIAGIAGIAGLLFIASGLFLWWRSRRAFRLRLLPRSWAPGPIVAHHRDLGVVSTPLLLLSLLTGVLMLFAPLRGALLGTEERPRRISEQRAEVSPAGLLAAATQLYPQAQLRRLTLPAKPGGDITVRLRQSFEWTPNGRTQLGVTPTGALWTEDAALAHGSAQAAEKIYPLHSAKVGGLPWQLSMTLSGLVLAMLGGFTVWSFWGRKLAKAGAQRKKRQGGPPVPTLPQHI